MNLSHRNSPNTKKNGISRSVGLSKAQKWPTGKEFHLNDSRDEPVAPAREFVFVCNINLQTLESIMPNLTARNAVWVSQNVLLKIMLKHADLGALSSDKAAIIQTIEIVIERAEFVMIDMSKKNPGLRLFSERAQHAIELVLRIRKDGSIVVATMHWLDSKRYRDLHDYRDLLPWA